MATRSRQKVDVWFHQIAELQDFYEAEAPACAWADEKWGETWLKIDDLEQRKGWAEQKRNEDYEA